MDEQSRFSFNDYHAGLKHPLLFCSGLMSPHISGQTTFWLCTTISGISILILDADSYQWTTGSRHFSLFDFKNIFQYVHMFEQLNLKLGEKFQWIQRHKK